MSNELIARGSTLSIIAELDRRDEEIEQLRTRAKTQEELLEFKRAEIERLRGLLREALRIDAGDFSVNVDEWLLRVREALGERDE